MTHFRHERYRTMRLESRLFYGEIRYDFNNNWSNTVGRH